MHLTSDTRNETEWGFPAAAERRLALASVSGLGKDGNPVSAEDVDRVGRWAMSLMRDAAIVELMLAGDVLPVAFDGEEVVFGPANKVLTEEQLDAFQIQLRKLESLENEKAEWKEIKKQREEETDAEYECEDVCEDDGDPYSTLPEPA